jgi:hypothetical protein
MTSKKKIKKKRKKEKFVCWKFVAT